MKLKKTIPANVDWIVPSDVKVGDTVRFAERVKWSGPVKRNYESFVIPDEATLQRLLYEIGRAK